MCPPLPGRANCTGQALDWGSRDLPDLPHASRCLPALQSFIRAYATYPRELKHIFHIRLLHLGHMAKSFGLRDAPKNLCASAMKKKKANLKR